MTPEDFEKWLDSEKEEAYQAWLAADEKTYSEKYWDGKYKALREVQQKYLSILPSSTINK